MKWNGFIKQKYAIDKKGVLWTTFFVFVLGFAYVGGIKEFAKEQLDYAKAHALSVLDIKRIQMFPPSSISHFGHIEVTFDVHNGFGGALQAQEGLIKIVSSQYSEVCLFADDKKTGGFLGSQNTISIPANGNALLDLSYRYKEGSDLSVYDGLSLENGNRIRIKIPQPIIDNGEPFSVEHHDVLRRKFDEVNPADTVKDVNSLFGGMGNLESALQVDQYTREVYEWTDTAGNIVTVTFQNGYETKKSFD